MAAAPADVVSEVFHTVEMLGIQSVFPVSIMSRTRISNQPEILTEASSMGLSVDPHLVSSPVPQS